MSAAYNLTYSAPSSSLDTVQFIQTASLRGDIALTPNWQVSMETSYDFQAKEIGYANVTLARQLHCWELNFQWVPVGPFKSYVLTIRPKATVLQDLKLQRKRNWFDLDSQ
jgi:lipopolysaccharide assembly outer membrane protein LptD (OstA)